jgi:CubicO group peptidase (beta-lactamase class C family)
MRILHRVVGATVCLISLGAASCVPQTTPARNNTTANVRANGATRAEIRTRLDRLVRDLHDRGLFDGAVVVGDGRDVVWEQGFGYADIGRKIEFDADTAVDGASLAKTFTAALVLGLSGEGRLRLDDPIRVWLPELPYPAITWRHLLSHSSGVPVLDYDYFDKWLPANEVRTTESLLGVLAAQRPALAFAPGTAFEYSSLGYDLAALAAARLSRSTYAELLKTHIFEPLGFTSAFVRPGRLSDFPGIRTLAYRRHGETPVPHDVFDFEGFHGGSNVYLSARELHLWNASFLEKPTLSAAALTVALQPARIGAAESRLTLGSWYRSPDAAAAWYSGHLQGFHSEVFRDVRTRSSVVYVSNNTLELWLQKALVRAIRSIVAGGDTAPLAAPPIADISPDTSQRLVGAWVTPDGERLVVERASDHLALRLKDVSYRMVQVDPRAFYVPGTDMMVGIAADSVGVPIRLYISSNLDERWCERAR